MDIACWNYVLGTISASPTLSFRQNHSTKYRGCTIDQNAGTKLIVSSPEEIIWRMSNITRSYQSADCDTDHSLVACKITLIPKKIHRAKPLGKPRIDVGKTYLPELVKTFTNKLEEAFCSHHTRQEQAVPHWTQLREDIYSNAKQVFGVRKRRSDDWFEASCSVINSVLEKNRASMLKHKHKATRKTTQAPRSGRGLSKKQQQPDAVQNTTGST